MPVSFEELDRPIERQKLAETLDGALSGIHDLPTRIAAIENTLDGRILFSTSLGLEDQVLLHAIAKAQSRIEVFTLDTGRQFPETYDVLSRSERVLGTRIRVVFPDAGDVEELVARDGIFGFRYSVEQRKACCHARKVLPLQRALDGAAGWVTGVRREQSTTRGETPFAAFDAQQNLIKLNPIADWTLEQVEAYIAEHSVPVNALHAHGFPSIGCQPCTRAIEPGEDIRAGRWWWEDENRKECGLHNRPGGSRNL
ncbi:phosphoadenylyl-sulfate reductase [Rhodomicrobium vannielii ATCC 17100]|uniref:phosphoadenylyl-sulfate reductase n=1 Tax=Rhodomicrobium vannielii TaxID=1069 RepID=UPI001917FE52|nr:phosphoadenylyl-sulfate reductase [Rhodomicrobium vannielii]MBJ7534354.1 phosphoadenylyl-sulfate reductase [Rhodomicrobium vannielii ATCC 17100]